MSNSFNVLSWHDAELREVLVDRHHPGASDEVRLRIARPEGDEDRLIFWDCYAMTAELNFGVIAEERIAGAVQTDDDPGLHALRERWKPLGVSLDLVHCYRLETSSASSVIKIYAKRFEFAGRA
jgi:hypothetical protein